MWLLFTRHKDSSRKLGLCKHSMLWVIFLRKGFDRLQFRPLEQHLAYRHCLIISQEGHWYDERDATGIPGERGTPTDEELVEVLLTTDSWHIERRLFKVQEIG